MNTSPKALSSAATVKLVTGRPDAKIEAFRELYRNHHSRLRSILYRCGIDEDLEDHVQEVFLKCWRNLDRFEHRSKMETWLVKIAINAAIDHRRKRRRLPQPFDIDIDNLTSPDRARKLEDFQLVQRAMANLKVERRVVLVLHVMEGYSLVEIATILGVAEGTVKSRLHKARQELGHNLRKLGVDYE